METEELCKRAQQAATKHFVEQVAADPDRSTNLALSCRRSYLLGYLVGAQAVLDEMSPKLAGILRQRERKE